MENLNMNQQYFPNPEPIPGVDSTGDCVFLSDYTGRVPEPPEEVIGGVLRQGHKMLISGPSKAGKSFLLIELCIALSEGRPWLGFPCRKSRVLYINLEIDPASCVRLRRLCP